MIEEIDFFFPFIVLFYGVLMTLVTSLPVFRKIANENIPSDMVERFFAHRVLGLICCGVGGLWLLQRLFIS